MIPPIGCQTRGVRCPLSVVGRNKPRRSLVEERGIHPRWKVGAGYLTRKPSPRVKTTSKDVFLVGQNDISGRNGKADADTTLVEYIDDLLPAQVDDVFRSPVSE